MADKEKPKIEKKDEKRLDKPLKDEKQLKRGPSHEEEHEVLVRILGYDIPGSKNLYTGLIRIKGISWAISNGICLRLNLPRNKRISELSKDEIHTIEEFLKNINLPDYMKNRRNDFESGNVKHLLGSDLDIAREFDIKRLREIKSYRGIRHAAKLPVRGQRTKSHFRTRTVAMGLKKVKKEAKAA